MARGSGFGTHLQGILVAYLLLALSPLDAVLGAEWPVSSASDIRSAMDKAKPGDVLIMSDGTWNDEAIYLSGRGKPGLPITLKANIPGKVILTGESSLVATGRHLVINGLHFRDGGLSRSKSTGSIIVIGPGKHIRLTNSVIDGYNPDPSHGDVKYSWVRLEGFRHKVDHNTFRNKTNQKPLLRLWGSLRKNHRHKIQFNHFSDFTRGGANNYETIQIGTGIDARAATKIVVAYNLFERCDGEIEIISNKTSKNVYRDNVFRGNRGTLTLRNGHRNSVKGNVFLGHGVSHSGGVRITGRKNRITGNYFEGLKGQKSRSAITVTTGTKITDSPGVRGGYNRVKGNIIAGNILVGNRSGIYVSFMPSGYSTYYHPINTTFKNNVVIGAGRDLLTLQGDISGVRWKGNIMSGSLPGNAKQIPGIRFANPVMTRDRDGLLRSTKVKRKSKKGKSRKLSRVLVGAPWRRVPLL